ncbi:hypothetical protein GCM10009123_03320 [Kangiella japonica]|uniref:Uncharacterized protein n=1 Tax=Kangiella japonica TaxID=647384 RepID=A0ABN0STX6_9GAMM
MHKNITAMRHRPPYNGVGWLADTANYACLKPPQIIKTESTTNTKTMTVR